MNNTREVWREQRLEMSEWWESKKKVSKRECAVQVGGSGRERAP